MNPRKEWVDRKKTYQQKFHWITTILALKLSNQPSENSWNDPLDKFLDLRHMNHVYENKKKYGVL